MSRRKRHFYPLAVAAIIMAIGPLPGAVRPSAADDPAWVTDWTVLLPEFATAIGGCVKHARGGSKPAAAIWVRRAAPMNRGLGLVALETGDGEIIECAADLATGEVDRFDTVKNPEWAEAGGKALYVTPMPACGNREPVQGNAKWTGWLYQRYC
jgi:hypothetical protein